MEKGIEWSYSLHPGIHYPTLRNLLIIWIILRPTKPRFVLQDVAVYAFNVSSTGTVPSPTSPIIMQPTNLAGVCDAAQYQGHNDFTVWSPFLFGYESRAKP
ncbi:hypothetical protein L6164_016752 [Bauhinia variegata]|uniref:Uncharacterized protein n=1 Tax=Bauhinia variegata TaxID=167791 RepID=A0ACB9N5E2_BAUVA|nr:hypothetical protein L6164_016752 [Bauhinia variegata]